MAGQLPERTAIPYHRLDGLGQSMTLGKPKRGFTLIEVIIVIAVIGILAAIAYPSYLNVVVRNNRSVARAALVDLAARQEGYFADRKTYASNLTQLGFPTSTVYLKNNSGLIPNTTSGVPSGAVYLLGVKSTNSSPPNFTIEAVPRNIQTNDTQCGTLTLTAEGTRGATGGGSDCW